MKNLLFFSLFFCSSALPARQNFSPGDTLKKDSIKSHIYIMGATDSSVMILATLKPNGIAGSAIFVCNGDTFQKCGFGENVDEVNCASQITGLKCDTGYIVRLVITENSGKSYAKSKAVYTWPCKQKVTDPVVKPEQEEKRGKKKRRKK